MTLADSLRRWHILERLATYRTSMSDEALIRYHIECMDCKKDLIPYEQATLARTADELFEMLERAEGVITMRKSTARDVRANVLLRAVKRHVCEQAKETPA